MLSWQEESVGIDSLRAVHSIYAWTDWPKKECKGHFYGSSSSLSCFGLSSKVYWWGSYSFEYVCVQCRKAREQSASVVNRRRKSVNLMNGWNVVKPRQESAVHCGQGGGQATTAGAQRVNSIAPRVTTGKTDGPRELWRLAGIHELGGNWSNLHTHVFCSTLQRIEESPKKGFLEGRKDQLAEQSKFSINSHSPEIAQLSENDDAIWAGTATNGDQSSYF